MTATAKATDNNKVIAKILFFMIYLELISTSNTSKRLKRLQDDKILAQLGMTEKLLRWVPKSISKASADTLR